MNQSVNDLVNDALFQWVDVVGLDLSKSSYSLSFGGGWSEYDLADATKELNKSRELDETGLTTFMMLRGLTESYLKDQTFNAYDLLLNAGPIQKKLAAMNNLRVILEDPLVVELISDFQAKIRNVALEFDYQNFPELEKLLEDRYRLAYLRRDALLSMERLAAHQFIQGAGDPNPLRFNPSIWEFWNVNSLIRALRNQSVPGISTILIRDPEALHSFFVFGVKNGEVITVLTDKDEDAHPAAKRMARRPDRQMWDRAQKHWFPYSLIDVETTDDGHSYAAARTQLVPIDAKGVQLKPLKELEPPFFVWTILMYELIRDKFWKQNYQLPELSYTGDMVEEPHALVGAEGSLVKTGTYKPLVLTPLTKDAVTSEATREQWERTPSYFNEWMVDRYANTVPDSLFNVIGENKIPQLNQSLDIKDLSESKWSFKKELSIRLEALDTQNFGSKKKLEDDRLWSARFNQMSYINYKAKEEYLKEKDNIKDWYERAIEKNAAFILDAAVSQKLVLPVWSLINHVDKDSWSSSFPSEPHKTHIQDIDIFEDQLDPMFFNWRGGSQYLSEDHSVNGYLNRHRGDVSFGEYRREGGYYCYDFDETPASIYTKISPTCGEAIAVLTGTKFDDLPWCLKHWHPTFVSEPYSGNHILDRLDPIDWVLDNPWRDNTYVVAVCFSKRAWNKRRKDLGLPKCYPKVLEKK